MIEYGILSVPSLTVESGNYEIGWVFKVGSQDILVSGLRAMLPNVNTRRINLWSNSNVNLANVTITSVVGEWVEGYLDTPIILSSNTNYKVTVYNNSRYQSTSPTLFTYNSKISYVTGCGGFTANAGTSFTENKQYPLVDIIIGEPEPQFNSIGYYITNSIPLTGSYKIKWESAKPANTSITVEYSTGEMQSPWQECSNGDVITSSSNLWLKVTLETADTSATPLMQSLWVEEENAPQDIITILASEGFRNIQGDINIAYDQALGSLAGEEGLVESFTESFTPLGLEEGLTDTGGAVGSHDYITSSITGYTSLLSIEKIPIQYLEHIEASIGGVTQFIHIDDINP